MLLDFVIVAVLIGILDAIYLGATSNQYFAMYKEIQGSTPQISTNKLISAGIAYLLLILATVFLVLPQITDENPLWKNAVIGALTGLVIYGVYNATNYFTFNGYKVGLAIQDTLWGTLLFTLVGLGAYHIKKLIV